MAPRYILGLALAAIAALSGCPATPQPSVGTPSPSAPPSAQPSASPTPSPLAIATPEVDRAPGGDHNSDLSEQTACKLLQEGPSTALTAATDEAGAPEVKSDDRRYAITLPAGQGGFVKFNSPSKAEWSFYTDRDAFFVVQDANGTTLAGARLPGSKFCGEIFAQRVYELDAGPYFIQMESATTAAVQLVVEETHPGGAGAGPH